MVKQSEPILIVSDNEQELGEIKSHLTASCSHIHGTLDKSDAMLWFSRYKPAVVMLNLATLHEAEAFYLKLFHSCENIYEIPHQVIVFIARPEMERAYELCRREIFHSFVIVRPMLSEHFLCLTLIHALEKRAAHGTIHRGRELLKRLGEQIERMRREFDQLMKESKSLREKHQSSGKNLAASINYRLGMFRDSLMGKEMKQVITVHDKAALQEKFEHLQEEEIAKQLEECHKKIDEQFGGWTFELEKQLSLVEKASDDIEFTAQIEPPHILIIDDDEIQRHMLGSILTAHGYMVREAANGNEGMSLLQTTVPDLVFLDYEMPEVDGIELLRRVRSSSILKELPVIMLTGHHEKEIVRRCMDNGADDYLVKPVKIDRLQERLDHFLPYTPPPPENKVIEV